MNSSQPKSVLVELKELNEDNIKLSDLDRLPTMTGWFGPILLVKLLWRVIVSDVFGQYADRRLMEAALDPASKKDLVERAKIGNAADAEGPVWIDYASDLGDGFDATYAIAYLLAQKNLSVGGHELPRGSVLVLGGDEVYPTAVRDDYKVKMRLPYDLAWPVPKGEQSTPMYLLPGNHDWYDGLVNFLSIFCREKSTKIGGWKTDQRRSYFAVEVAKNWWVWGIDIALVRDMDQPQADYFVAIAEKMPKCGNIILCSAEPGWYKAEGKGDAYRTLSYAAQIAKNAKNDLRIPIVLSGDSHHYARYVGDGTHYITSGGGGAFLHGTLELEPNIHAKWLQSEKEELTLAHCHPSKDVSKRLLEGNWNFGIYNKSLTRTLAGLYLGCAFILSNFCRIDLGIAIFLLLLSSLWGYARYQEGSEKNTAGPSIAHAVAHFAVILAFSAVGAWLNRQLGLDTWHWSVRLIALGIPVGLLGPWLAGKIYGLSLLIGCKYFGIGHNDAFSSMQLDSYRHFLRIRLEGDDATVYVVKLDKVPSRKQWKLNPERQANPTASVFIADPALQPELLEEPILIHARATTATSEVKTPDEVPAKK